MNHDEALRILAEADLVISAAEIELAIDRLAREIASKLHRSYPLVLSVMGGAVFFSGQLLPRLEFPLECDYLHATRYRNTTRGYDDVEWRIAPATSVAGRTVLVLDDILDEGITLAAIHQRMMSEGAVECLIAVLAEKAIDKERPVAADFVGVRVPNRYVFGCGMDIKGAWRNLPDIRAVKGH